MGILFYKGSDTPLSTGDRFFLITLKILWTMHHYPYFVILVMWFVQGYTASQQCGWESEALTLQSHFFANNWKSAVSSVESETKSSSLHSMLLAKHPEQNTLSSFTVWAICKLRVYPNSRECPKALWLPLERDDLSQRKLMRKGTSVWKVCLY